VVALSPLVEKALHLLTDEINLSTGLSHASDRNKAKELLTRLHDAGESLNVTSIVVWGLETWMSPIKSYTFSARSLAQSP
jgi:hypothetical protein